MYNATFLRAGNQNSGWVRVLWSNALFRDHGLDKLLKFRNEILISQKLYTRVKRTFIIYNNTYCYRKLLLI